ncbi:MAG TPA: DUF2304 domain-containing protein [Candidatus Limnocylindria bacterium]|jgi:hypothetical protein|nr:DUF2304 domain-containing protein [Candidatus Limnocylindria bacterium]
MTPPSELVPLQLTPLQQAAAIVAAAILFISVLVLIYRRRLGENYGAMWFLVGLLTLIAALWQDGLRLLARALDAVTLTAPLFLLSILFLTAIAIHFSVKLSEQAQQVKKLAQEVALLRARARTEARDGGGAAEDTT